MVDVGYLDIETALLVMKQYLPLQVNESEAPIVLPPGGMYMFLTSAYKMFVDDDDASYAAVLNLELKIFFFFTYDFFSLFASLLSNGLIGLGSYCCGKLNFISGGRNSKFKDIWDWETESKILEACEDMDRWAINVLHTTSPNSLVHPITGCDL